MLVYRIDYSSFITKYFWISLPPLPYFSMHASIVIAYLSIYLHVTVMRLSCNLTKIRSSENIVLITFWLHISPKTLWFSALINLAFPRLSIVFLPMMFEKRWNCWNLREVFMCLGLWARMEIWSCYYLYLETEYDCGGMYGFQVDKGQNVMIKLSC